MGRPTKAIDSKKSRALSQAEYEERQKKKLGIQKFNDMRARQRLRAESRARCWARYTEEEKNEMRVKQRERAFKFRNELRKAKVHALFSFIFHGCS